MRNRQKVLCSFLCMLLCCVFPLSSCQTGTNEGETTQPDNGPETIISLFGGDDDYQVIFSDGAGTALRQAITDFKKEIKTQTGKNPTVITDTNSNKEETAREVLIGNTTRDESEAVLATIDYVGWCICFRNGKLVIHGSDDDRVVEALEAVRNLWTVQNGTIQMSSAVRESSDISDSRLILTENGAFRYRIVYSATVPETVEKAIANLTAKLVQATGQTVEKEYDSTPKESAGELLIGETNREESGTFYAQLTNRFEYRIALYSDSLVVGALSEDALLAGIAELTDVLTNAVANCYNGMPSIEKNFLRIGSTSETAYVLPALTAGNFRGTYDEGNDSHIMYYTDVTEQDYTDYCAKLAGSGCQVVREYSLTDNRYTLFSHTDYSAYVSWLPKVNAIRVYVGKANVKYPSVSEATADGSETPALWQLEVATKAAKSNGGMSYVIKLSDGTFLIVDGGYNYNEEGDRLYNLLRENTPDGQKPVVSGWFVSHLHGDHYGGLQQLASRYSDQVEVRAFYYNFPEVAVGKTNPIGTGLSKTVEASMGRWSTAARYGKLHSGMTIGFAGATATVIATHEDVYPLNFEDGNDTSTVIRLDIAGQRILFLADAYYNEDSAILSTIDKSDIQCDIVQMSHHGYEGCTSAFYQATGASVVLWPMNIDGYQENSSRGTPQEVFGVWYYEYFNYYVRTSSNVKKILVSGAGTIKLVLPYNYAEQTVFYTDSYGVTREATGRLIDYNAIYSQRTN